MTWFGLLSRNLVRRPGRSCFTLLGVALAIASYLTLTGVSKGIEDASRASLRERRVDLVVMQRGMVEFFASSLPETLLAEIARVPGVSEVSAELGALVPAGEENHALVGGWDTESGPFKAIPLAHGRLPIVGESAVVLGEALAEGLHADVGATVTLAFAPLKVVGIANFTSTLNRGMAIMPLPDLQALLARPNQVTLFQLRLTEPDNTKSRDAVRAAIGLLRRDLAVSVPDDVLKSNRTIVMLEASSSAISIAALVLACLLILNTMVMAVDERTHEIGILSTIGWSRRRIVALILSEGLLLAAAGGTVGALLGQLGSLVLRRFVMLDSGVAIVGRFGPTLTAVAFAIVLGGLGALYPAWKASRLSPTVALRHT